MISNRNKKHTRWLTAILPTLILGVTSADCDAPSPGGSTTSPQECVVLLHGLCRTRRSMNDMAEALNAEGYRTFNP